MSFDLESFATPMILALLGCLMLLAGNILLAEYRKQFFDNASIRMFKDLNWALLSNLGSPQVTIAGWLWLVGFVLIAAGLIVGLYSFAEWACSVSAWVRTWNDGACSRWFR